MPAILRLALAQNLSPCHSRCLINSPSSQSRVDSRSERGLLDQGVSVTSKAWVKITPQPWITAAWVEKETFAERAGSSTGALS